MTKIKNKSLTNEDFDRKGSHTVLIRQHT